MNVLLKADRIKACFGIVLSFALTMQGCKDSSVNPNPQQDNATVSAAFGPGVSRGVLEVEGLDEASGLANSRSNPEFLWSHNDSGGDPTLYLLTTAGADSGRYQLDGTQNIDWEDMAIGAGPIDGVNYLYAADIGDNRATRESLSIYRTPEPNVSFRFRTVTIGSQQRQVQIDLPADTTLGNIEVINYRYEDGARDAEALMVDPTTKDIFIITKREPSVILYKLPFPQNTIETDTAIRVAVIPYTFITAGDISLDGSEVLIKNYQNVYYWQKSGNETIEELLATPAIRLDYIQEPQGEAIAWKANGTGYFTLSEIGNASEVEVLEYNRN